MVAVEGSTVVGLVHYLFHRSTIRLNYVCYLQDLFTAPNYRGRGVGRHLIEAVHNAVKTAGSTRVYWHTYADNATGRALYDKVTRYSGVITYTPDTE